MICAYYANKRFDFLQSTVVVFDENQRNLATDPKISEQLLL